MTDFRKGRIKILFYVVGLPILLVGCDNANGNKHDVDIPVHVITIAEQPYSEQQSYVGTIEAKSETHLSFASAGTVTAVNVTEGQRVSAGQVLATLNDEIARHADEVAQSTLAQAEDGYKRAEQVYNNGSLPEVKWIEIQSQVSQARSMAEISRKNLSDCVLRAPKAGIVGEKHIEPGMNVLPDIPTLSLMDISDVKAVVNIPENKISDIALGGTADIVVSALDKRVFSGTITEKGIVADKLSHCYAVKISVSNSDMQLLPGMVCRVVIRDTASLSGFRVPVNAVQLANDNRRFVWTVVDNKAVRKFIDTGDIVDNSVFVENGLQTDDIVIVDGYGKVSEGSKVVVK